MSDHRAPPPRHMVLVVYPGFQLLDATGPASVFAGPEGRLGYEIAMGSAAGGLVRSGCGVAVDTAPLEMLAAGPVDTLLVAGAERAPLEAAMADERLAAGIIAAVAGARRYGSVCSGAFLLAALGLLEGRRVATHWEGAEALARRHPDLRVDAEALYVTDGPVWTSAGVSTGIDMALALLEADHGAQIANAAAQRLVLYARRPGGQTQFSPLLAAQRRADAPFAELQAWIRDHLAERLDAPALAARAGLSERSFYRRFREAVGETPARYVERLRLDAARALLERPISLKQIAAAVGFGSSARLTAAFERRFGVAPALYRRLHLNA